LQLINIYIIYIYYNLTTWLTWWDFWGMKMMNTRIVWWFNQTKLGFKREHWDVLRWLFLAIFWMGHAKLTLKTWCDIWIFLDVSEDEGFNTQFVSILMRRWLPSGRNGIFQT
jgi:hypothetical protein